MFHAIAAALVASLTFWGYLGAASLLVGRRPKQTPRRPGRAPVIDIRMGQLASHARNPQHRPRRHIQASHGQTPRLAFGRAR